MKDLQGSGTVLRQNILGGRNPSGVCASVANRWRRSGKDARLVARQRMRPNGSRGDRKPLQPQVRDGEASLLCICAKVIRLCAP